MFHEIRDYLSNNALRSICISLTYSHHQYANGVFRAGQSRCEAPLSSGGITSSCSGNRAMTFLMKIF